MTTPGRPEADPVRLVPSADARRVDDHASRLRIALDTLATIPDVDTPRHELVDLVVEFEHLAALAPDAHAETRRVAWGAVAHARAEVKRLESGPTSATPAGSGASLAALEALHAQRVNAEATARKARSGPKAFKAFVAARRKEEDALEAAGFASIDDARQAASASANPPVDNREARRDAERQLQLAEADWARIDATGIPSLPDTPETDVARARAYRAIGTVIDDDAIVPSLRQLINRIDTRSSALSLLTRALHEFGLDPGADPIATGQLVLSAIDNDHNQGAG